MKFVTFFRNRIHEARGLLDEVRLSHPSFWSLIHGDFNLSLLADTGRHISKVFNELIPKLSKIY